MLAYAVYIMYVRCMTYVLAYMLLIIIIIFLLCWLLRDQMHKNLKMPESHMLAPLPGFLFWSNLIFLLAQSLEGRP